MEKKFKYILTLILLTFNFFTFAQNVQFQNLGFEERVNENGIPSAWHTSLYGEIYNVSIDKKVKYSGKQSLKIECKEKNNEFRAILQKIPAVYSGSVVKISAFLKLKDVENAVGLILRIDGKYQSIYSDNMMQQKISGTIDWKEYSVVVLLPEEAKSIVIGIILSGEGTLWADNISVLIDNKPIEQAKLKKIIEYPAEKDTIEFAKSSKINIPKLNDFQLNNLDLLGKTWGFLKYYHPAIAEGNFNWDFELFRIMLKILVVENKHDRDNILTEWIKNLGEITKSEKQYVNDSAIFKPDFSWIDTTNLSVNFIELLNEVKNAKRKEKNYYVGLQQGVENPVFKNENPYKSMYYPDCGYRLLSVYRYWNMINYFFPYKYVIGEDWNEVLKEFIPKFIFAKDSNEYVLAALELITKVNDTHANIYGSEILNKINGENAAFLDLVFVDNDVVVTNIFDKNIKNIKNGDVITKINNRLVTEIIDEKLIITPASNYETKLRDIASDLLRTNDTIINIEYHRNDTIYQTTISAKSSVVDLQQKKFSNKDTCFSMLDNDIAYLYLGEIQNKFLPKLWKEIEKTKGLIIDLRCYPSDFVVHTFSNYLLPKKTEFAKFSKTRISQSGNFNFYYTQTIGSKNNEYYKGKVAILVNENTQSQAEFTSMAFQTAPKAKVFGSKTAGADGNVSAIYLPGGIFTYISGIGVYYPDGRETQRIGIVPDVEVKPTIKGIQSGKDEVLEKAIEWIKEKN